MSVAGGRPSCRRSLCVIEALHLHLTRSSSRGSGVPGESFYPFVSALDPQQSFTLTGEIVFAEFNRDATVTFVALADSCDGDEFIDRDVCRIVESSESNNRSVERSIQLP